MSTKRISNAECHSIQLGSGNQSEGTAQFQIYFCNMWTTWHRPADKRDGQIPHRPLHILIYNIQAEKQKTHTNKPLLRQHPPYSNIYQRVDLLLRLLGFGSNSGLNCGSSLCCRWLNHPHLLVHPQPLGLPTHQSHTKYCADDEGD